ncbi:MAG: glycosyltransferase [Candidatus Kuenenia sp.]|nr:glycosyltransferase [Candidatus Kuenenia hertensis]
MLVSVIITTKNEEKNIGNCLQSIRTQSYPQDKIEIIVVDNNSTDKTKEIIRSFCHSLRTRHSEQSEESHIQLFNRGPERSTQRNFGMIDIAKGKYVMFVDADMILSPCLIESCVKKMEQENANFNLRQSAESADLNSTNSKPTVALHIPEIVLGKKYFSKVRRFERRFYDGTVIDGARFFLKEVFIKVGGFDESMSGPEDWDIDKQIKQIGKIGLLNYEGANCNSPDWELYGFIKERGVDPKDCGTVIYHNEDEFDIKKYLQKKTYYAKSFNTYINKWGNNDPDIKKQFGFWYRYLVIFLEEGKWKRLITHPILVFGMYYLRFMIGIKFLIMRNRTNNQLTITLRKSA